MTVVVTVVFILVLPVFRPLANHALLAAIVETTHPLRLWLEDNLPFAEFQGRERGDFWPGRLRAAFKEVTGGWRLFLTTP